MILSENLIFKESVQEMSTEEPLMRRLSSLPEAGFEKYRLLKKHLSL